MRERNPTLCNSNLFILLRVTSALCSVVGVESDGLLCVMLTVEQGLSEWTHSVNVHWGYTQLEIWELSIYQSFSFCSPPHMLCFLSPTTMGSLKMLQWIRSPPAGLGGQWMSGGSTGVLYCKSLASGLHSTWHCHLIGVVSNGVL